MSDSDTIVKTQATKQNIQGCVEQIQGLLKENPNVVQVEMSLQEFPNRYKDLPEELVRLSRTNPKVKLMFNNETIIWGKPSSEEITVAMCTQPHRKLPMLDVVKSLLPQCDRMCICFNNYNEIPKELPRVGKLNCVLAGEGKEYVDLGAQNKMLFLGDFNGYYASVDDDLIYPSNYIEEMKKRVDFYDRERICSLHGMTWKISNHCVLNSKDRLGFWQYFNQNTEDHLCHCVGMGVAMCYPKKIALDKFFYLHYPKNIGDDQITAIWSMTTNTKLMQVNNIGIEVKPTNYAFNGLYTDKNGESMRAKFINGFRNWKEIDIIKNDYVLK